MSPRDYDAIVIGAGLNGLAAAGYLAKAGRSTLVLEGRDVPGGLSSTEEIAPGFRCDTGLHDAGWLSPDLARELNLGELDFLRPDPPLCAPLREGGALHFWRDAERTAESIRRYSPRDAERWPAFIARMEGYARVLSILYESSPPRVPDPGAGDALSLLRFGLRLRKLGEDGTRDFLRLLPMPASELLDEWFENDTLKGALGATGCFGLFLGPRSAGTGFMMLHRHVGAEPGVFGARGLMRGGAARLGETLAKAAAAGGAELRYGSTVARVEVRDGEAVGVTLAGGQEISARAVVSGADPRRTFLCLVGARHLTPEFVRGVNNIRYRGAWAKVHLGLSDLPEFRGVDPSALSGVISMTPSLDEMEKAYDDAKYGRMSERPQLEMTIPSLGDSSLAPPGRHVASIRVQYTPFQLRNGEWTAECREALGDRVVARLAEYAPNLPGAIVHRQVLTPADLACRFSLTEGDASDGELALDQILFMRPMAGWARYATPIGNLFLCGSGAHPGPGIVGGAGRLAAREVNAALKH